MAVGENFFWQIQPSSHEERGPIDCVKANDFFSDEMDISGPVTIEFVFLDGIADRGDVVGERVGPNVENVFLVTGPGDAPLKGGAADGKIPETTAHEGDYFVAARFGLDEV